MNIVMTANSPGEVASWLRPMVAAFRQAEPTARVHVCLAPCTYATGAEEDVVRSIPGVTEVYRPARTVAWAVRGRRPPELGEGQGLVLFLGGDLMYGALLGWRTGWPAFAYTEGRVGWPKRFRRFFVPHAQAARQALRRAAYPEQVEEVGDLMLDGLVRRWPEAQARRELALPGDGPVVGLFPGSRRHELRHAFPLMMRTAALIAAERPEVQFVAALSPFATREVVTEALEREGLFSPTPEKLVQALYPADDAGEGGFPWSPAPRSVWVEWLPREGVAEASRQMPVRVQLVRGAPYDVAVACDLVLTIPGSNTAELAGLGIPMVVIIPLQYIEEIPLEGLPGLIGGVPWLGPLLKRKAIAKLAHKVPFTAWPNRKVGREIVPELRKLPLTSEEVAETVLALLSDDEARQRMARQLREVMGEAGASQRIAQACLKLAQTGVANR